MFIFFEIHWDPCTRIFDTYYSMYRHCVVSSTYSNIPTYVLFIAGCNGLGCKRKTFEHLYISWSNESWRKFVDHSTDEKNWETNGRILWLTGMVFCFENCSDLLYEKMSSNWEHTFENSRLKVENLLNFWDHWDNFFKQ